MYAIQALTDPQRIDVKMDGILDAGEIVRCISQASALAEAGSIRRVCADLSTAEPCGLDQGLIVAALRARASLNIRVAVIASKRAERVTQKILTQAGLTDAQARIFTTRDKAETWLELGPRTSDMAATDRRHLDLAATLLAGAGVKGTETKTARRRRSVA